LQGLAACANGQPTRTPFAGNMIPASRIDPTAKVLMNVWGAPDLPGNVNNFAGNTSLGGNQQQYTIRGDYTPREKHRLFGRSTYWNGDSLPSDPFQKNFGGLKTLYGADDGVFGDTYNLNSTTVLDFRGSYLRALHAFRPQQTGTDLSQSGPAWAALASQVTLPEAPLPNVTGFAGFSGVYIQSVSNEYFLSGSATKILGRHSLKFGGEARRWDWGLVQSNTAAGSFNFNNTFTSANPLAPGITGYAFASYLLGTSASGSLAGAARVLQPTLLSGLLRGRFLPGDQPAHDQPRCATGCGWILLGAIQPDGGLAARRNRSIGRSGRAEPAEPNGVCELARAPGFASVGAGQSAGGAASGNCVERRKGHGDSRRIRLELDIAGADQL
jgi:hypothetical protein